MLYLCGFSHLRYMILSMTGFGRHEVSVDDNKVIVEVRSLNGKIADVRIKTALQLGQHEIELRKLVLSKAVRGKIDLVIDIKGSGLSNAGMPNAEMIKVYFLTLQGIAAEIGVEDDNLFSTILRMPNVFQSENGDIDAELSKALFEAVNGALDRLKEFRVKEGQSLHDDLHSSVEIISQLLKEVSPFEEERTAALRERLGQKIVEIERESLDANRFEQEILYYMDKLDIHEEKVRLEQHCQYFLEVLAADGDVKGKKLNFISQEIGREINTLGAKAQWSAIQRLVVQMKDHLEKIKEQLANAL
jgi:uncharacterized protein (TIGR00255 family)